MTLPRLAELQKPSTAKTCWSARLLQCHKGASNHRISCVCIHTHIFIYIYRTL